MKNEFIYQIFPQTFNDGLNTGSGNLKGIINKLDYLKNLGITRIWLSPIYLSPFKDSGYDVADYYSIDPRFGNMQDFDNLVSEAKKRNITLLMDVVFNHTSDKNIWFQKALKGEKKYQDFYIFKDGKPNNPPTNWKSKMGGSSWEFVPTLNKYYLHLFAKEQPDLNWRNPDLLNELKKILTFWMNKGIDGFRLDVCNLYDKPKKFIDDKFGDGRRFYTDGKNINKYFKWMNKVAFSKSKSCFTVGEVSSTTKEKSARYAKKGNKELDSVFTFLHLKVDYVDNKKWTYSLPNLNDFWNLQKEWQEYYQNQNSTLALFMNNHDQPRAISRFGDDKKYWYESATSIFAFTSLMRGVPFIYQGEEIGMTNLNFKKIEDFKDVETSGNAKDLLKVISKSEVLKILKIKARDNARSVMQWNDKKNAGFTSVDTSLYINENFKSINVQAQENDKNSILNFYKSIINLRLKNDIFNDGVIEFFNNQDYSYKRKLNDEEYLILTNWTNKNKDNKIDLSGYKQVINNYKSFDKKLIFPYQILVMKKQG